MVQNNGDIDLKVQIGTDEVVGIGSFHKTLPHNGYGEVDKDAFKLLVKATKDNTDPPFGAVPEGNFEPPATDTAPFTNPRAGLAKDQLTQKPSRYTMPPAPTVLSDTTAAEMTELYWMALLRDVPFDEFSTNADVQDAATEVGQRFGQAVGDSGNPALLQTGIDVPGQGGALDPITAQNLFRLGLPGEDVGPLVSQFFLRPINFGTQTIDQRQVPYRKGVNYLTQFHEWKVAQDSGNGEGGRFYNRANEAHDTYYEPRTRYISTMRDLARFVHKDALHQAYFNAALLMLSGGANWTPGTPYSNNHPNSLAQREAGFGTLGGPHILALVSEVATRALKVVWHEKWQVHLRLRPEVFAGLVHVQSIGVGGQTRAYGLPAWVAQTEAAQRVRALNGLGDGTDETLLLPMAFTSGSPLHPAYGAGHATVAGACVTVLKAFFRTFDDDGSGNVTLVPLVTSNGGVDGGLMERPHPYDPSVPFVTYDCGVDVAGRGRLTPIAAAGLTLEGELNKLAMNVAMGRSMGGVHWRTDNTRSLMLGEAMAARILADITADLEERKQGLKFTFRTFSRKADGEPKIVVIEGGKIEVDGIDVGANPDTL
jgi:hypothetical protein